MFLLLSVHVYDKNIQLLNIIRRKKRDSIFHNELMHHDVDFYPEATNDYVIRKKGISNRYKSCGLTTQHGIKKNIIHLLKVKEKIYYCKCICIRTRFDVVIIRENTGAFATKRFKLAFVMHRMKYKNTKDKRIQYS